MKKDPFIILPVIGILFAIYSVGKEILPGGQVYESQSVLQQQQTDNIEKRKQMQQELVQLKQIENPTKHNIWLIGHLEKSIAHLLRFEAPKYQAKHASLVPLSVLTNFAIFASLFSWHYFKNRSKYLPRPGLNNHPKRIHPGQDLVAEKTHWQSMAGSASNFQTQTLITTEQGLKISASFEMRLFYWAFISFGLTPIVLHYILMAGSLESLIDQLLGPPAIFFAIGLLLAGMQRAKTVTFNRNTRTIYTLEGSTQFEEAHALQVITRLAGGHSRGVYHSYELNLVLKDGRRIHLLSHGAQMAFEHQESQLSELLGVPVWQA